MLFLCQTPQFVFVAFEANGNAGGFKVNVYHVLGFLFVKFEADIRSVTVRGMYCIPIPAGL